MSNSLPQPDVQFKPAEDMVVEDLETLKVLADPLRLQILEQMARPQTVKKIASKLNIPPTKLYYHVNLLEKHDLIKLVDMRVKSGIIEKHYQVAAKSFRLKQGLLTPAEGLEQMSEGIHITLTGLFENTLQDILQSIRDGVIDTVDEGPEHRGLAVTQLRMAVTEEQAQDFYERFSTLLRDFQAETHGDDFDDLTGKQVYKLLYVIWPSSRIPGYIEDDEDE